MLVDPGLSTLHRQLGFTTEIVVPDDVERLHGAMLTSPEQVQLLIERVSRILGTDKPSVAASQFTKWYCRSLIAVLYEFSVLGIARSATLRDVSVLFPLDPPLAVHCNGRVSPVTAATRESLRELTVIRLFAHNWNLVFKRLHELTGIREDLLWENGSMYINHFYRTWMEQTEDPVLRERLEEDYRFIHHEAPPELYGELQCFNPFQWTGKPVRSSCCLRFHLPDKKYCKGCPIANGKLRH